MENSKYMDINEDFEKMLSEAYLTDDDEKVREIAGKVLEKSPDNPEALVLMADSVQEDETKINYLEKALEIAKKELPEDYRNMGVDLLEDDAGMLYIGILQRLGFVLFPTIDIQRAFDIASEIIRYDIEDETFSRTLFYRCLLEMGEYEQVLRYAESENVSNPAVRHSRAIALYKIYGPSSQACQALWDIFREGPDIPFYLIGYWVEPDGVDAYAMENFHFSIFFEEPWSKDEELLLWLSRASVLFGYFTERFNSEAEKNLGDLMSEMDIEEVINNYRSEIESSIEDIDPLDIEEKDAVVLGLLSSRECSRFVE